MELAFQLMILGLSQGAIYALVATGFGLVLAVSHVFHFAHAAIFALAGFLAYAFTAQLGLPFPVGILIAVLLTVAAALAIQFLVYSPLKRRSAGTFAIVLASVGAQFAIEAAIALIWGTSGLYMENPLSSVNFQLGGIFLTLTDIVTVGLALVGFAATYLFLNHSRTGRAMLAYSDNPTMARVVGIDPAVVGAAAMVIAGLLIFPAALATGWYSSLQPAMGLNPLLYSVAAVVLGGIGSITGAFLGSFVLGLLSAAVSFQFPAFWADTAAFIIMMLVVVWRPQGLFGNRAASRSAR